MKTSKLKFNIRILFNLFPALFTFVAINYVFQPMAKKTVDYRQLLNFGNLVTSWFYKNLTFVFFIFFLILIYIANVHYAEKKVKEIQKMQKEIRALRWEYMTIKSKVMFQTQHSELSKDVGVYGLGVTNKKPYRIVTE